MNWTQKRPGPKRIVHVTEYVRPKEKAPSYPKLPESREPSDAELNHFRQMAREHVAMLKEQFKAP